ncbi:hypothetical protein [Paracoccus aminophilus]|uniref:Uncharacterized protein n=1 Tax=Paracoccus aminophilus JCM 7686 TaxID=1367847 RepID=S5XXN5_PARAH|nr:hypothetical protein [Paracoccus aminophilus]AGT10042.1 hypothetical protein JCM7686_3006 [Paracoccus aminophilus JCM 7686]
MSNHDETQEREAGSSRLAHFVQHEREGGVHPAVKELHQRPAPRAEESNRRAVEYARIERGRQV